MVHLFIYGVRDAIATHRSCPALPELLFLFRFSFSALIADLPSFFHSCGLPIFALAFCWIKVFESVVLLVVYTMYITVRTMSQCLCVIDLSHTSWVFITSSFATWRMLLSGLLIGSAVRILYSRTLMLQNCFMLGWGSVPVYKQLWFSTTPSDSLSRLRNHIFMPVWHWFEST